MNRESIEGAGRAMAEVEKKGGKLLASESEKVREGDKLVHLPIYSAMWIILCAGFLLYFTWDNKYVGFCVSVFLSLLFTLICFIELYRVENNDPKTQLRYKLAVWLFSSIFISLCSWWVSVITSSFALSMALGSISVFIIVGTFFGTFILCRDTHN
ncbi:hypothetical protein QJS04_geneDACA015052 [Acorus gramineus]|uniref:Uncharacterized protein n=1 Tax=Acorus gramineus TaxID=55184 RepID=A0AAV9BXF4_ACOGR|nr:hypothetical protein QJS04_geneDACA015052 [Acorus gramineus]